MAIFHFEAAIVSRGSGQSAVAKAAYEARERIKSLDDGKIKNYTYKGGLIDKGIALPDEAAEWMNDRSQLWNAVEQKENESKRWKTAQLARRFIYSIPAELSQSEQIALTKEIAESFARRGMIADYALHEPDKEGDRRNVHAHFLTTLRDVKDGEFANKNREWNTKEYLKELREEVCEITNKHLRKYNIQVDHRSYEEQGIDKTPTQHKGVKIVAHERRLKKVNILLKQKEEKLENELKTLVSTALGSENQKQPTPQAEPLKPRPTQTRIKEIKFLIPNKGAVKMNTQRQTIEKMVESMDKEIKEVMNICQSSVTRPSCYATEIMGEAVGICTVKDNVKALLKQNEFVNTFHISELAKIDAQANKDKQDKVKPPRIDTFRDEHKESYAKGFYYGLDRGRGYIDALIHLEVERENARKQKQQTQEQQQTRGMKR